jgi:hypothetical protein
MHFVVGRNLVNQPVTARDDQLAQSFIGAFRNDPSSVREVREGFGGCLRLTLQNDRVSRRIASDEACDLLDVLPCRCRPPYSPAHRAIRFSISSSEMKSPRLAASRPLSIFC